MLSSSAVKNKKPTPVRYLCPITQKIMLEPVIAADGYNYEREAIEKWFETNDTIPLTNLPLEHKILTPNFDKRSDILEYLEEHPELYDGEEIYLPKSLIIDLIAAIKSKQPDAVVKCLAKDKRLLSIKLDNGYTAWHLAAEYGSIEIVALLLNKLSLEQLKAITNDNPSGFSPTYANMLLEQSLGQQDVKQANLLLSLGADLEQLEPTTKNSLLHRCIMQGNQVATSWALYKQAKLEVANKDGNTPLLLAILHKEVAIVELLLGQGANIQHKNHNQYNAVSLAALSNSPAILQLLVKDKSCLPALHLSLELKDTALLKALLAQDTSNIEAMDAKQCTALYIAVSNNDLEATKLLLAKGAKPNAICIEQLTPLHMAAINNNLDIVNLLLQSKINLDAANVDGNTPLHLAAKLGKAEVIPVLLKAGANHKAMNNNFQTPLKLAKQANKPEVAKLIVQTLRSIKLDRLNEIETLRHEISELKQEKIAMEQAQLSRIAQLETAVNRETQAREAAQSELKTALQLTKQDVAPLVAKADAKLRAKAELEAARVRELAAKARAEAEAKAKAELEAKAREAKAKAKAEAEAQQKIISQKLPTFLKLVVEGEQDQAEAMLKETPELALHAGNVTDLSGRTFNNITGFQYAVWALDWHMWKMILRDYLPEDEARKQIKGLDTGSWVNQHGKSASWQNLIDALDEFIKLCNQCNWYAAAKQWNGAVGNAQQQLPVHVVNQYCHPTRSFDPCPNFSEETSLPRSRKTNYGDWFTCKYNGGIIGKNCFAFCRGHLSRPIASDACDWLDYSSAVITTHDCRSLVTYLNHQTQLYNELLSNTASKVHSLKL